MCVVTIAIVFKYFKLIIIVSTTYTIKLCVVPCTCVISYPPCTCVHMCLSVYIKNQES